MSAFRSPNMTGLLIERWFRASSRSDRWSRVDGGRYAPMSGVSWLPAPSSRYCNTIPTQPSLCSPGRCNFCLGPDKIITKAVATVHCVRDLHLRQEHEFIFHSLNVINHLWEAKPTAISNVVRTQVESHEARRSALRQWQRRVKAVTSMSYLLDKIYDHIFSLSLIHLESLGKMWRNPSCIIY